MIPKCCYCLEEFVDMGKMWMVMINDKVIEISCCEIHGYHWLRNNQLKGKVTQE